MGERRKQNEYVESSRQKMKEMRTIVENEDEVKEQKEEKKMSLKARSIALAKKLNCCKDS